MGVILRSKKDTTDCVPNSDDLNDDIIKLNDNVPPQGDRRLEVTNNRIPPERADLRRSICGFVPAAYLAKDNSFRPFDQVRRLNLEQVRRKHAQNDVESKKETLKRFFVDLLGPNPTPGQLNEVNRVVEYDLPWPDFYQTSTLLRPTEQLALKFRDQPAPSDGTGFYIGNRYIVTAGHVANEIAGKLPNYRVVFNMTGVATDHQVYSIRRIVHLANPNFHFDNNPIQWIPPLNVAKTVTTTADFAVLELDVPNPWANEPPALNLVQRSLPVDTRVFMIGTPEGLPLKYIDGGKITEAVDETETATLLAGNQATFAASIDMYGGNSGGPLFDMANRWVTGTVMGSNFDAATIGAAGGGVNDRSQLAASINAQLQARFDNACLDAVNHPYGPRDAALSAGSTLPGNAIPIPAQGNANWTGTWKPVDPGFSDFFWDIGLYPARGTNNKSDSHTWSYGRVLPTSSGLQLNRFSRVDIIRHLNHSFTDYCRDYRLPPAAPLPPGFPVHPGGNVLVNVFVFLSPPPGIPQPLQSDLRLFVVTKSGTHQCETVQPESQGGIRQFLPVAPAEEIRYTIDSLAPQPQRLNAIEKTAGLQLNSSLMAVPAGLHSWTSIKVKKVGGVAVVPGQVCPVYGKITAQFSLNKLGAPGGTDRDFKFRTLLHFTVDPDDNAGWIANIGIIPNSTNKSVDLDYVWQGPL